MTQVLSPQSIDHVHLRLKKHAVKEQADATTITKKGTMEASTTFNPRAGGVNKKLMRLAVDSRSSTKRNSIMFDESGAPPIKTEITLLNASVDEELIPCQSIKHLSPDSGEELNSACNARFPKIEEMSHFHYAQVDFADKPVKIALSPVEKDEINSFDPTQALTVEVSSKDKSWVVKRSQEDFVGLDRQIHRCLYDRRYSKLPELKDLDEAGRLDENMVQQMQFYLSRFSELAGNNINCGPILNWLELDNHGNHLVVMEADDSAINVPAVAAGRVIKRYQAQAPDEMSLEVGDFLSVIDMPSSDETIWWRGKKGFEVGFFPSHCIEILNEREINDQILHHLQSRPVSKRRGKFISFLRFFFKSRPSKDELMQHGILRERVFGCDLGERLALTGRDTPLVLDLCAEVIEEHGIVDGIYRLSGIVSNLQKLRLSFDCDEQPPNLRDLKYLNDVHCISSLLKTYFRELPNPLFTHELYDKFVIAIKKADDADRTVAFHHVIQRLPPPHYRTMNKLLRHLNYCASKSDTTNMTAKNLAIVWAPNLLKPNSDDSVAALTEFRTQAIIVEYMIRNVDVFFDKNLASAAIAYYPEMKEQQSPQQQVQDDSECIKLGLQNNSGPKLISLEEARQRIHKQRELTKSVSVDGATSSPRHSSKLRGSFNPPKMSTAAPISPLPTLLSLEEAQARTNSNKSKTVPIPSGLTRSEKGSISSDISTRELSGSVNSPRRTRKWFGLFSKASSKSSNIEDANENDLVKASHSLYTKKTSPQISGPTRSQSEYRLHDIPRHPIQRSESFSSTSSADRTSISADRTSISSLHNTAPIATPESEFEINLSDTDSMSLMSAIVSVRAKYMNLDDGTTRYQSSTKTPLFSVGEPLNFRKLPDDELLIEPPATLEQTPPLESAPPASISAPYSSHRRGAPSNDSGYLSQASTLNRGANSDGYLSSQASTLSRTNTTSEQYGITPANTFSPERKSLRNSGRVKRNPSEDDVPIKRVRSLSPESYVNMTAENVSRHESDSNEQEATSNTNSSDMPKQNNYVNIDDMDLNKVDTPVTSELVTTRPSTLNVTSHCVNTSKIVDQKPSIKSSLESLKNPEIIDSKIFHKAGPNSIMSRLSRSTSVGTATSPLDNRVNASPEKETVFGPRELFYQSKREKASEKSNSTPTTARQPGSPVRTPTRTHFSFTRSQSMTARRSTVNTPDSPHSSNVSMDSTDGKVVMRSSVSKNRDEQRRSRRLSVRERAAMFGDVTSPNSPNNSSWSELVDTNKNGDESCERTSSETSINDEIKSPVNKQSKNSHYVKSENEDPKVRSTSKRNFATDVSSRDFDLRCRVSDSIKSGNFPRYNSTSRLQSNSIENLRNQNRNIVCRSTDRLVRSTYNRGIGNNEGATRPKSEILSRFDYRSFDDKMNEQTRSYSVSTKNTESQDVFLSSKSENRLYGSDDYSAKQIGNFPLTLRTGSGHNSQVSIDTPRGTRPRSLYENERRSYYDNITYEVV
eukprot:TCONS_00005478-protein